MSIFVRNLFLLTTLLCSLYTKGQIARFNAGLAGGLNFAELEGDGITDYYGLNAGMLGTARLSKHSQLGLEILFSQNGEYILPEYYPAINYGRVRLNHIEIPVHFDVLIGIFERDEFYDWRLHFGMAYTRLVSYSVENINKENVNDQIIYGNREAMLLQAGTTYHFTRNFGINFRASLPMRVDGLSWTLATQAIYML